jgi:5-formyltetrahydrofolate cyclo-ligase
MHGLCGSISTQYAVNLGAVDLAPIPGVAFDVRGGRLDHGAGYYDMLVGALTGARPWSQGTSRFSWWMSLPLSSTTSTWTWS